MFLQTYVLYSSKSLLFKFEYVVQYITVEWPVQVHCEYNSYLDFLDYYLNLPLDQKRKE